jgi:hypothetical protein
MSLISAKSEYVVIVTSNFEFFISYKMGTYVKAKSGRALRVVKFLFLPLCQITNLMMSKIVKKIRCFIDLGSTVSASVPVKKIV